MHLSQTQLQNVDQNVLRRTSVEEEQCKPPGKYMWNKAISFCVATLYFYQCNTEEAGYCAKKIDDKSVSLGPTREGLLS